MNAVFQGDYACIEGHVTLVAKFLELFLDRDGRLHCQTMEDKFGLSFCS